MRSNKQTSIWSIGWMVPNTKAQIVKDLLLHKFMLETHTKREREKESEKERKKVSEKTRKQCFTKTVFVFPSVHVMKILDSVEWNIRKFTFLPSLLTSDRGLLCQMTHRRKCYLNISSKVRSLCQKLDQKSLCWKS